MKPNRCRMLLAAAVLLLLSLRPSSGQILTYTSTPTPVTAAPFFDLPFTLPAFDSNLGTLSSIGFSYQISSYGTQVVTTGMYYGFGGNTWSTNYLFTPSAGPGFITPVFKVGPAFGDGGEFPTTLNFSGSATDSGGVVVPANTWANWQGPGGGILGFTLSAASPTYEGAGINFTPGASTLTESGVFTVTYTYAGVPEPSTWALLMGGLVALGAYTRRRHPRTSSRM